MSDAPVPHTPLFSDGGPSGAGYSEFAPYLRCPKEYQLQQVRGITVPASQEKEPLVIGQLCHAGRNRWLARNCATDAMTWVLMKSDMTKVVESMDLPIGMTVYDTALRYITEYVEHWSMRAKPRTLAVEWLLGPTALAEIGGHERTARLDDIGEYPETGGKLAIGELKTTGSSVADCIAEYTLHGQPIMQRTLWDAAPQGKETWGAVDMFVLDIIQKGWQGKRCAFARIPIQVTDHALAWGKRWLNEAVIASRKVEWGSDVERRISSCTRVSAGRRVACQYRDLCQYGKSAAVGYRLADGRLLSEYEGEVKPWD